MTNLKEIIKNNPAVMVYFTTPGCNVCKALKPKIKQLLSDHFSKVEFIEINAEEHTELSADFSVFAVPTILIYFNGTEHYRKSRYISIQEISTLISRPYHLLFD